MSALFVALGGTGYAALHLPADSVGNREIQNGAITPVKIDRHLITGSVRAWAEVSATGKVLAGERGPKAVRRTGPDTVGQYLVTWNTTSFVRCAAVGGIESPAPLALTPGSVTADPDSPPRSEHHVCPRYSTTKGSRQRSRSGWRCCANGVTTSRRLGLLVICSAAMWAAATGQAHAGTVALFSCAGAPAFGDFSFPDGSTWSFGTSADTAAFQPSNSCNTGRSFKILAGRKATLTNYAQWTTRFAGSACNGWRADPSKNNARQPRGGFAGLHVSICLLRRFHRDHGRR